MNCFISLTEQPLKKKKQKHFLKNEIKWCLVSHDFRLVQAQSIQEGPLCASQLALCMHGTPLVPWEWPNYLLPNLFHGLIGPYREERRYKRLQKRHGQPKRSTLGIIGKLLPPDLKAICVFPLPYHGAVCRASSLGHHGLDERIQAELQELLCFCSAFLSKDWRESEEGRGWQVLESLLLGFICFSLQVAVSPVCNLNHRVSDLPLGCLRVGIRFGWEEPWFLYRSISSGVRFWAISLLKIYPKEKDED